MSIRPSTIDCNPAGSRSAHADDILRPLDFSTLFATVRAFADQIESHFEALADVLLEYESFEVVRDETDRTLDLLRNLDENQAYFQLRVGSVTSFLPRNQPLYALSCFVLIPSLMAGEVHFRIPHSMRHFFPRLLETLRVSEFFPNVVVSTQERVPFLQDRSALRVDPETEDSWPVTDAVIFTGTPQHADKLRRVFDRRTLFITNGSGHNPVVIAEDADLTQAVEAVLSLQLYNQGQDCANPNAILVHADIYEPFLHRLREELKSVRVGHYRDRSCRVGPISDPDDLPRIQSLLVENHRWLDPTTPGIIRTAETIVEPTIIGRPLTDGGNFTEVFAPILFAQRYDTDPDLALYFEHPRYARNAMYVTVYGTSPYVESLIDREFDGTVLHDRRSVLHNTHLHAPGMERGTQPYGGRGYAASNLSIDGRILSQATLPQRDIFEHVAQPLLAPGAVDRRRAGLQRMTILLIRDVPKLLGLKTVEEPSRKQGPSGKCYVDALDIIARDHQRYIEFDPERMFTLIDHPNVARIATLSPRHIQQVRTLHQYLHDEQTATPDEFHQVLYAIPKLPDAPASENRKAQGDFFRTLYQLLFGRDSGPRLAPFLLDADRPSTLKLLDV